MGDRHGAASFGVGPGDARVGLGLVGLELGADVLADFDIGDIDRDDFERGLRIEPAGSTALEMRSGFSSTSMCDLAEPIALTMPSPTRAMIVSSVAPPIELIQVGPHRDSGFDLELNAVFCHGVERFARRNCDRGSR